MGGATQVTDDFSHGQVIINGLVPTSRNEQGNGPLIRAYANARAILPPFRIDFPRVLPTVAEPLCMRRLAAKSSSTLDRRCT